MDNMDIYIYMDNWREAQVHTSALSTNLTSRTSNSWNLRMLDWILLGRLTKVSSWKNSCDTTISHMEFIMVLGESPRVGKLLQPSSTYSFGFIWCSSTSDDTGDFSRLPPSCHLLWKKAASAFGDGISILTNSSTTDSRRFNEATFATCTQISWSKRLNRCAKGSPKGSTHSDWTCECEWYKNLLQRSRSYPKTPSPHCHWSSNPTSSFFRQGTCQLHCTAWSFLALDFLLKYQTDTKNCQTTDARNSSQLWNRP